MFSRSTLAALTATLLLAGCSHKTTQAPATVDVSAAEATPAVSAFAAGPTQLNVTHVISRADDGSSVILTIDGVEAGTLTRGENKELFVPEGKHKVGGYVQTLFGLGRVTIPSVDVTTKTDQATHVSYSVTKNKPAFTLTEKAAG